MFWNYASLAKSISIRQISESNLVNAYFSFNFQMVFVQTLGNSKDKLFLYWNVYSGEFDF